MRWLMGLVAATAGAAAWGAALRGYYHTTSQADEVHFARGRDGWRVALSRYHPQGAARGHPVVLCHGLASNRFSFDLDEEVSLARFLSGEGFDVYILELRGHGLSDRPRPGTRDWGFSFDDYLERDVPAALEKVREISKREQAHFVGHSMGGILLYAHLGVCGQDAGIRSGITLGSSLDYSGTGSDFDTLLRALFVAERLPSVPLGTLGVMGAALSGRLENPMERFNYWLPNTDPSLARRLNSVGFHTVSSPVLRQLATAFEPGGLRPWGRGAPYSTLLHKTRVPVLAVAGDRDRQCSPSAARRTLDALGSEVKELAIFGRTGGQPEHYGHFDLLMGLRAREEVFPALARWLEAHDS
jgi:alpha-beta hydrolase superfamily lysophospholipase